MTTASQRIWEAIYAAEFVRIVAEYGGSASESAIDAAAEAANHLANMHEDHYESLPVPSRFRKRSR